MTKRMNDVARFAGVSTATVSRVLRNRPGVADATRQSVLTALDVMGLERPSVLRAERAPLVGLVVPDLQNPVFPAFCEVLAGALSKRGLMPVLCTRTADGVSEANYVEMLLRQNVAGIVFVGGSYADAGPEHGRVLHEREMPMVLINAADGHEGAARIAVDDASAVEQALDHLTALGHERIGLLLGPAAHVPSVRKLQAFSRYLDDRGQGALLRELVAHTMFSLDGGAAAVPRLVAAGATAVVCASDALALGAIRRLRKDGLSVPEDVSVVGFDDSPYMIATDPPLTTVRQPVQLMAAAAGKLLVEQIEGHRVAPEELLFEPELIVRSSTRTAPVAPRPRRVTKR
ncbi:LacI family DNA-binding transcriptional regulator [Kitasatospora sp. NPDC002040]|uniref:LacI family DNA-binding transcriptional regulator n=1 Tax=Kitasatospora sp. NPDC002040 TaxID=3154661 RepID=UPI00331CB928